MNQTETQRDDTAINQREAFEKWADEQGWPSDTAWRREGFVMWQASLSQPAASAEVVERVLSKSDSNGDWYCQNCGYIYSSRVTYSETCDTCHIPAAWHSVKETRKIELLPTDLIEIAAALEKLDYAHSNAFPEGRLEAFDDVWQKHGIAICKAALSTIPAQPRTMGEDEIVRITDRWLMDNGKLISYNMDDAIVEVDPTIAAIGIARALLAAGYVDDIRVVELKARIQQLEAALRKVDELEHLTREIAKVNKGNILHLVRKRDKLRAVIQSALQKDGEVK